MHYVWCSEYDDYYQLKQDHTRLIGFSSIQKHIAAMRCHAYGAVADILDAYLCMSKAICIEAMYKFCKAMAAVFGGTYLRAPNKANMT